MTEITLPHLFKYRPYQKEVREYIHNGGKLAVQVWNRRAGKDLTDLNIVTEQAIQVAGNYWYSLPEYSQARKAIWEGVTKDGVKYLDCVPKEIIKSISNHEMKIELRNNSVIRMVGSDQYNSLMGAGLKGVVHSEYSLSNPLMRDYIRPMIAETGGWEIINGTPRGKNHLFDVLDLAMKDPKSFAQLLTVDDTQSISPEVLAREKAAMDHDTFMQEYYCSFDAAIKGSYYSEQIATMRNQQRFCRVPYDSKLMVYTAFDPGDSVTAIIYFQVYGKEIRIIDADEFYSPSIEHIFTTITQKPYQYGNHFMPFDATVYKMNVGMSLLEQLRRLGLMNIQDLPQQTSKMSGIKLVQSAFPSFWVDDSLEKKVIEPLSSYAPKFYEARNTPSQEPEHNWASHMSDAVRYMVIAINSFLSTIEDTDRPRFVSSSPRLG